MKKSGFKCYTTFIAAILLLMGTELIGQSNREIGDRFGSTWGLDMTIPFTIPRFHPEVYFRNDVVVVAYFDSLSDLEGDPYGLKFYSKWDLNCIVATILSSPLQELLERNILLIFR